VVPSSRAASRPAPATPVEPEDEGAEEESEGEESEERGGGILGRTVGAILGVGTEREEAEAEGEDEKEAEELDLEEPEEEEEEPELEVFTGDRTNLNQATFEQLRDVGFSVTQATRVITYRERQKGFKSLDDLANVPGMPRQFLREVQPKLTL